MLEEITRLSDNVARYLCCPRCRQELKMNEQIFCPLCKKQYEVQSGIPVLVDLESLPKHLSDQIKYFENESVSDTQYCLEPWQESYVERFKENFSDLGAKVVIDCGTGSGYMAIELAKRGAFVIACDLTLKSLLRLKGAAKDVGVEHNLFIVCCSAEALPFKKSIADYFISNAVLEHLPHEKSAIEEINRVCKDDSGVMVTVPLAYKYLNPLMLPLNYVHDKRIGHLRRYDEEILLSKFSCFRLVQSYYTGHFAKVFMTLFNMVFHIFNKKYIENIDRQKIANKLWASNIICFLKRA